MKTTSRWLASLLLCFALTLPAMQQRYEEAKIMSLLEGLCLGLVIGVAVDAVIIVGVQCYKKYSGKPPPVEPPPSWIITNSPPTTNSFPTNASVKLRAPILIASTNSTSWWPAEAPFLFQFSTVLQSSVLGEEQWTNVLTIDGWETASCRVIRTTDAYGQRTTNVYGGGAFDKALNVLPALENNASNSSKRIFRLVAPQ